MRRSTYTTLFLLAVLGLSACSEAVPVSVDMESLELDPRFNSDDITDLGRIVPPDSVQVYSSQSDTTDDGQ